MKTESHQPWTAEEILALGRSYQGAAVLAAAADLDLFSALSPAPLGAAELARALQCDLRGLTILLDAVVALRLLEKSGGIPCRPHWRQNHKGGVVLHKKDLVRQG